MNSRNQLVFMVLTLVFIIITTPSQASDPGTVKVSYYVIVNNIPVGVVAGYYDKENHALMVDKFTPFSEAYRKVGDASIYVIQLASKYCSKAETSPLQQALTYYVNYEESYTVRMVREAKALLNERDYTISLVTYYPESTCIPLSGKITVYKTGVLINKYNFMLISSSEPLPKSTPLLSEEKKLGIFVAVTIITTAAFLVVSQSGKYRIV